MYLFWDVRGIALRLKKNKLSPIHVTLSYILSPLLSLSNGLFFGLLIFSHQIVEYSFKGWLGEKHPLAHYYNWWSLGMTFLTIFISFGGIYLCYRANKKGDGKDFWKRLACLSFPINFHIIIYSLALLCLSLIVLSFVLYDKITFFNQTILHSGQKPSGYLGSLLKIIFSIFSISSISKKISPFLLTIRGIILMGYPLLSLIPPLLSLAHYLIVRRFIRQVAKAGSKKRS